MKLKSSALKVMHIVETEAPELLEESLNGDLFDMLNMQPISVLIQNSLGGNHAGFCLKSDFTNQCEIVLEASLFDATTVKNRHSRLKNIVSIYLHECAHRLTMNQHDARFMCMSMILHMRAGNEMIQSVSLYDLNEENHDIAEAFKFAYQLATSLAESNFTAEECAAVVTEKYKSWFKEMELAPEIEAARKEEAEARKVAAIAKRNKIAQEWASQIKVLRQDRWQFAFYSALLTVLTVSFFN